MLFLLCFQFLLAGGPGLSGCGVTLTDDNWHGVLVSAKAKVDGLIETSPMQRTLNIYTQLFAQSADTSTLVDNRLAGKIDVSKQGYNYQISCQ